MDDARLVGVRDGVGQRSEQRPDPCRSERAAGHERRQLPALGPPAHDVRRPVEGRPLEHRDDAGVVETRDGPQTPDQARLGSLRPHQLADQQVDDHAVPRSQLGGLVPDGERAAPDGAPEPIAVGEPWDRAARHQALRAPPAGTAKTTTLDS